MHVVIMACSMIHAMQDTHQDASAPELHLRKAHIATFHVAGRSFWAINRIKSRKPSQRRLTHVRSVLLEGAGYHLYVRHFLAPPAPTTSATLHPQTTTKHQPFIHLFCSSKSPAQPQAEALLRRDWFQFSKNRLPVAVAAHPRCPRPRPPMGRPTYP
jgi:hypothetical protein